ncbi:MAG: TIGR00341 family protein [Ignavibacteria bacterium]|nr:TIGR00341 family protein [Ignavibacteria bacterium]
MKNILDYFKLDYEKEDYNTVIESITKGVIFRGTNLWILVFAIFIASLGLNMNSTAVIIGAMLISPLMGPIMGLGLGTGINDLALVRKALSNYFFAAIVGLITSTIYFSISPLNDAHSEILARTTPNIYDVLIALFGGLAGIVATSTKQKGNVIPGVAIATALMPPLCTAGYGLATFQFNYSIGALYLFIINTVFIALATFVTVRFLKFPFKHLPDEKADKRSKRIIIAIVVITLLPSIYFGYDIVRNDKFIKEANRFIETEAIFPGDYLLKKTIDAKDKSIELVFGGNEIKSAEIEKLKNKLKNYELDGANLEIKQGFAYLKEEKKLNQVNPLSDVLAQKEKELAIMNNKIDSIRTDSLNYIQLIKEAKTIYPELKNISISPIVSAENYSSDSLVLAYLQTSKPIIKSDRTKLQNWLQAKLNKSVQIVTQ